MTSRRNFIKAGILTGISATLAPGCVGASEKKENTEKRSEIFKNWIWTNPNKEDKESDIEVLFKKYRDKGINGIFFESDSEKHFRIAKQLGLEAHRWIWTVNRGEKSLLEAHPDWYAINRKGESCSDKPPYVDYYRWLCPSKEEVIKYLEDDMRSHLSKDYIDGIHLDYVRYCDVILPVNLWDTYHIEQTKELPEYDYCYCETCKKKFKEWSGLELDEIQYPEASLSWRQFRYNAITNIVNRIAKIAAEAGKPITAAVFPTPEVARRNVRQDWINWNMSGICPMIYHGFYKENVSWIGDAVAEGVRGIDGRFPLYAGLFIPDFKNNQEIEEGITLALQNGAKGVSLFGQITDGVLDALQAAYSNITKK